MHRREALRVGLAVGATTLAGCTFGYGRDRGLDESFEGTFDWETAAHIGPEEPLEAFEWAVDPTDEQAHTGERSLRVFTEGDHDDGTAWATHPVRIDAETRYRARVTAQFWSESESFNTLRNAVMRLGTERPDAEEDFPDPGQNTTTVDDAPYGGLREPLHLQEGWREYAFEWTVPVDVRDLFVSVGVSVVWETDATHYVDDVRVELTGPELTAPRWPPARPRRRRCGRGFPSSRRLRLAHLQYDRSRPIARGRTPCPAPA